MLDNVHASIMPLTVLCGAFGFYTTDFKQTTTRTIFTVYYYMLTLMCPITYATWTAVTVLNHVRLNDYFVVVMFSLMDIVSVVMLTFYRVKCMTDGKVINDILDNVCCADRCLRRLGITVPHKRNLVLCVTSAIAFLFIGTVIDCLIIEKARSFGANNAVVSSLAVKFVMSYCALVFFGQFVFVLYIVKQRIGLVRRAVETYSYASKRKLAWRYDNSNREVLVGIISRKWWSNLSRDQKQFNCKDLKLLYNCISEAFHKATKFYTRFYQLNFLFFVFSISLNLHFSLQSNRTSWSTILYTAFSGLLQAIAVVLCIRIKHDFDCYQTLIARLYYLQRARVLSPVIAIVDKTWLYQLAHSDADFDCGYFVVHSSLIMTLFDFVTLFIFAM